MILIVVLLLMLLGSFPAWPHSRGWGYYRQVAEAYVSGIEARVVEGKPVEQMASVASFFVSRIDALLDPLLEQRTAQGGSEADVAKQVQG